MKLFLKLHATAELHTDADADGVNNTMSHSIGLRLQGKQTDNGWALSRRDRNFFRPAISVRTTPEEDGTLVTADFSADRTLMIFMVLWSLVVIGIAVWKGWLLLVMLPVFWACVFIGFAKGVKDGKQDLIELLGAYEVID